MTVKIYNQGLIEIKALKMNRGESTFLSFLCGMLYANFDGVIVYLSVRARVKEMILVLILHIIIGISLSLLFFFFYISFVLFSFVFIHLYSPFILRSVSVSLSLIFLCSYFYCMPLDMLLHNPSKHVVQISITSILYNCLHQDMLS